MNNFLIILKLDRWTIYGRTNQHFNLEQTMVFRINTRTGWNLIHKFPGFNTASIVNIWIHPVF